MFKKIKIQVEKILLIILRKYYSSVKAKYDKECIEEHNRILKI